MGEDVVEAKKNLNFTSSELNTFFYLNGFIDSEHFSSEGKK